MPTPTVKQINEIQTWYRGVWTAKAVNTHLDNVTGGDARVVPGFKGGVPTRAGFATFAGYLKENIRRDGYFCFDKYRPGQRYWGKTPKKAAIAAGFTLLA